MKRKTKSTAQKFRDHHRHECATLGCPRAAFYDHKICFRCYDNTVRTNKFKYLTNVPRS